MIRIRWRSHPEDGELAAFADNELTGASRAWVISHLTGCERCRAEVESFQEASRALEGCLGAIPGPWLEALKQRLLQANLDCPLDRKTREKLFGESEVHISCRMVEEVVGRVSAPG